MLLKLHARTLAAAATPHLMGIVNITPDSFYWSWWSTEPPWSTSAG